MGAHQRVPDHTAGSDTNENLEIMAQMWQCHLLKPETNKGDLRLYCELFEESYRGCHHSEILKTNTKSMISSIWMWPQGPQGCQKKCHHPLNKLMEVWCANIESNLQKV